MNRLWHPFGCQLLRHPSSTIGVRGSRVSLQYGIESKVSLPSKRVEAVLKMSLPLGQGLLESHCHLDTKVDCHCHIRVWRLEFHCHLESIVDRHCHRSGWACWLTFSLIFLRLTQTATQIFIAQPPKDATMTAAALCRFRSACCNESAARPGDSFDSC